MLSFSPTAAEALRAQARPAFLDRVRRRLVATYPHFLPSFPEPIQARITGVMLERAAGWGLTRQSALWAFCEAMVSVAPDFDDEPEIRARLDADRTRLDLLLPDRIATMPPRLAANARRRASRLAFFTSVRTEPERTAAAIPVALFDRVEARDPAGAAAQGWDAAATLGLGGVADAGLIAAACRSFWGPDFVRLRWAAPLWHEPWSPAERVELLRFRLAAQHRRFL